MIDILPYTISVARLVVIAIGFMSMTAIYASDTNAFLDVAEEIEIVEYENTVEEEGDFDQKIEHDDDAISSLTEYGYNGSIVFSSATQEAMRFSFSRIFSPPPEV